MTQPLDTQVLIVGAGPTGLTLACDLARRGIDFRLIDAAATPFAGSRGKGIQPRTLEVFDDLGILDRILASGAIYPQLRLHWRGIPFGRWKMHEQHDPTPDVPYPNTWLVPQWRTLEILRDRLVELGGRVDLATELTGLEQDGDAVTASLTRDGRVETVRAAYVVGADGGHSRTRKAIGVDFIGAPISDDRMVVADVQVDGLSRTDWHVWPFAHGGPLALCPLPASELFQLFAKLAPGADPPAREGEALQQFFVAATGRRSGVRLRDATWVSLYRPQARLVDRYRVGRVFLAGDAARAHPPTGGQGLNTGVQDAYNLGWKLAHVLQGADPALLDTYEAERLPIAASVLGLSTKLLKDANRTRRTQRRGAATQQLGLHYRGGPLSREERQSPKRVQAGDRAPDAPCHDATGTPTRLFDLFRGPHMTVLAFGPGAIAAAASLIGRFDAQVLICAICEPQEKPAEDGYLDTGGHARRAYGVRTDTLVVVRPDGYIGLMTERPSSAVASEYMRLAGSSAEHLGFLKVGTHSRE